MAGSVTLKLLGTICLFLFQFQWQIENTWMLRPLLPNLSHFSLPRENASQKTRTKKKKFYTLRHPPKNNTPFANHLRRLPKVKTRDRHLRRIAHTTLNKRLVQGIRTSRILKSRTFLVDPSNRGALRVLEKAEIELLVGLHVANSLEGDDKSVVILAVREIVKIYIIIAKDVLVALGTGPDEEAHVGTGHEVRIARVV